MAKVSFEIPEIPHGHGLSFKKGIADGLPDRRDHEDTHPETHSLSSSRGLEFGVQLKNEVAKLVTS